MPALTYDAVVEIRRQVGIGATDLETASHAYSLDELAQGVRETRGLLQAIADGWTQEQLLARPPLHTSDNAAEAGEDRWSATEAISHLIATQNWYLLHMGRLLGRREHFEKMVHGLGDLAEQDISKADLSEGLRAATDLFLATIASIPADADLTQKRSSTFFGDLSLRGWVLLSCVHDVDHLQQIQRVATLPTFPVG
jgi:hypothetical protein